MSYIFDPETSHDTEHKIAELEQSIHRYRQACKSDWARPIDYFNLIDALFTLEALKDSSDITNAA